MFSDVDENASQMDLGRRIGFDQCLACQLCFFAICLAFGGWMRWMTVRFLGLGTVGGSCLPDCLDTKAAVDAVRTLR